MERLKSHKEFVSVLKKRNKFSGADIVVHYKINSEDFFVADNSGDDSASAVSEECAKRTNRRLGLAVSKSAGNAVKRNKIKRRFRVIAKKYEDLLPLNCDIVLRAKPSAYYARFDSLEKQTEKIFRRINSVCEKNMTRNVPNKKSG